MPIENNQYWELIDSSGDFDIVIDGTRIYFKVKSAGWTPHLHANLPLLDKFSIGEDQMLMYDGRRLESDIDTLAQYFISKKYDDTAEGLITFLKGIISEEKSTFNQGLVTDEVISKEHDPLLFGTGFRMWRDFLTGDGNLILDHLVVRKEAIFNILTTRETRSVGGQFISSAAQAKIKRVEESASVYRCFYESEYGQLWKVTDQARCQRDTAFGVRYYWCLITGVSTSSENNEHWIELSKTVKDGSGVPSMGDEIVLFGHRGTDEYRKNLILISSGSFESQSPTIIFYKGIVDFSSLTGKEKLVIGDVTKMSVDELKILSGDGSFKMVNDEIKLEVKNSNVGVANLVKQSRCNNLTGWDALNQFTKSVVNDPKYGSVVQIERTSGTGNFQKTFTVDRAKLANTQVVYYVIAKRVSETGEFYFGGWADTWNKLFSGSNKIDFGDGWYMYWSTFTAGSTIGTGDFGINTVTGKWMFYAVGATVGNKPPSTWSESDEDIRTDIEGCGINIAAKGITLKGNTTVVDFTGNVSKFSDGKFKSKRIATGEAGTDRIEIDGEVADPSISIIDSTDAVKVEISPKLIQTLTEIANAGGSSALTLHSAATISLFLTATGNLSSDLGSVYNFGSLSFVMGKLGNIVTPAFSYSLIAGRYTSDVDSYATVSIDLQKYNGTSWITYASVLNDMAIDSSKSTAPTQYILSNIPAGTYRFVMEITVQKGDESTVSAQVDTSLNAPYTLVYPVQKTTIGKDGIAMVWSTSQYERHAADGMEVRYGNYGLRVNNSGIYKTTDGGTWTSL